jgi:hypothetical protein
VISGDSSLKQMQYRDCWLTVEVPSGQGSSENAILKALATELPGINLRFVTSATIDQPIAAEAFVPETHASDKARRISTETILKIASGVLSGFAVDHRKVS